MKTRPCAGIAAALLVTSGALAQERAGAIRGVVTDKDFGAPLAAAQVQLLETGRPILTTDQGTYSMPDVRPGRYTIVFSKEGYVRVVRPDVLVIPGQLVELSVALPGDITDMDEFVVQDLQLGGGSESALLQLRLDTPAMLDSIGSDLMSRAGASDAAGALRLVSGATVQDGKSAVIRGLPDRYVSSQMNGVRLPSADDDKRAVELDQFPSSVIQSIEVQKTFTPDQQGDASGGAVDVRLRGVPDEPLFVQWKAQTSHNTQTSGRSDFLSYRGGGFGFLGDEADDRGPQLDRLGGNWEGAVGTSTTDAPIDSKWSLALGGSSELGDGWRFGAFASTFYERDSSSYRNGRDDSYWVVSPGDPMTPRQLQTQGADDFRTALYDVARSTASVRWGSLATIGVASEQHSLTLVQLFTHTAEDSATFAQDTRGKQFFFPGHDPNNPTTPGHDQSAAAPYLRLETLEYTERQTSTLQLHGHHDLEPGGNDSAPLLDWFVAHSQAGATQPDKRQFGEEWRPEQQIGPFTIPAVHLPYKPGANFTLGNVQRTFRTIDETSDQVGVDFKVPFVTADGSKGLFKTGVFADRVRRAFAQDTFSNFSDNSTFTAPFDIHWSSIFPGEVHPITASLFDVDYDAEQEIAAGYIMASLPVTTDFDVITGVRFEQTAIDVVNAPEANATWFAPGSQTLTDLNPGDGDVHRDENAALPALACVYRLTDAWTLRASYARTVARQTFKEVTPILQQEYLGGPVFIGNPELRMSKLHNFDLRADYAPVEGTLLSASLFRKDLDDAIEYVQRPAVFDFTTAVNYPKGRLEGLELEARQRLEHWWPGLSGFAVGANATFIASEVTLPQSEQDRFNLPGIRAPMARRDMTNAPEHLYNAFVTYEAPEFGTRAALFYTVTGDTLLAGAGEAAGNFVPNVYALEFDTLNLSLSQTLTSWAELTFGAKNLTDPDIETAYRSPYIGSDVVKSSRGDGIEYSIAIGGTIRF